MKINKYEPRILMALSVIACAGIILLNVVTGSRLSASDKSLTPVNGASTKAMQQNTMKSHSIKMTAGEIVITASIDDSQTSKDFIATLPRTMLMTRYGDREYYAKLGKLLSKEGVKIDDYKNGDVTYYVPGGSFAIFFDKESSSSQSGLIRMGKITSDLTDFHKLGSTVSMRIDVLP